MAQSDQAAVIEQPVAQTVVLTAKIINDLRQIEQCDTDVWHSKGCTNVAATVRAILALL